MRERLKTKPSEVVCNYLFKPAIKDDSERSFFNMINLNLTHVLMLYKQEILKEKEVQILLEELINLKNKGSSAFELNPLFEDYYFNMEQYLISQVGLEYAGGVHTGRSRNDLYSTISRMNVRDTVIDLYARVLELRSMLLELAFENKETVLTGYTHMQPAQPITLSHYLIAISEAIERDYQRLVSSYERLNLCPLGSGAFAGTSFNIDREYTAKLLGFSGIIENSIDGVASRDYLLEISGDFTILGSTINRFANDLYIWSTDEFGFVEVDDSMAACSSIMPQKKNPITLEHIKAKSSHLLGAYVSIFTCMKGIPYGHSRDLGGEAIQPFWSASKQMEAILELLTSTLKNIKFNHKKMKMRVDSNFSTVTELADELVKKEGLSFRVAHQIVGNVVSECVDLGLSANEISIEMLNAAAETCASRTFDWTQEDISRVLNSTYSVNNKFSLGSPSPKESEKTIENLKKKLGDDYKMYEGLEKSLILSRESLKEDIEQVLVTISK